MEPMSEQESPFGRVADDGTVYVRTADGERMVGQVPDVDKAEAMAFYTRRYDALALEVELLAKRVASGAVGPDEARKSITKVRAAVTDASAVGDLGSLLGRLDALAPVLAQRTEARRAEKAKAGEQAKAAKEQMVADAEKLAAGNDWRGGVNRFRTLLEKWQSLPRIDRSTDDALWHRFSSARTTYTRRRKAQFAQQNEQREQAKAVKEKIIAEAEPLAASTEWGPTSGAFRDLMTRWKAAGSAPRDVEEKLWQKFRGLQDQFFAARQAANDTENAEFAENQAAKEKLLDEYEPSIQPEDDLDAAKARFRDLLERWSEIGKVPRDAVRVLDGRLRKLETSLKQAEDEQWKRTDPEARARAQETASKLAAQISELEAKANKAEAKGDVRAAKDHRGAADTYRSWLEQAEKAVVDFGG